MNQKYILYNPHAGNGSSKEEAEILGVLYSNSVYLDIMQIESYEAFFQELDYSDEVILCGGDGTLNRFANHTQNIDISNAIYYYPTGNWNDFAQDLGLSDDDEPQYRMNDYLRGLPSVSVDGQSCLFLNNVGFGIDGYCCQEGNRLREEFKKAGKQKNVNYAGVAIKRLLHGFSPRNAVVTVDGKRHTFNKVWIAPTMQGRYYGGGMMAAPNQDRLNPDKTLSVVVIHGAGRLKTLCMFPSIFKGKHIRYKNHVTVLTGNEITVEFDRPTPLQIDGETVPDVRVYQARGAKHWIYERKTAHERLST